MMRFLVLASLLASSSVPAIAADLAGLARKERSTIVLPPPGLWRGHFSGGRNYAPGADFIGLDWADKVEFFADNRSCRSWMRGLKAQYRTYEGFKGCTRIR